MSFLRQVQKLFKRRAPYVFTAGSVVFGVENFNLATRFSSAKEISGNFLDFSVHMIPHPQKVKKGGEDAYYADPRIIAVADGVGGWAEVGIDPAKYSRELCANISIGSLVTNQWNLYREDPKKLLIDAADLTKSTGSSTLVIVSLDEEKPVLRASYIGDAGYMILRQVIKVGLINRKDNSGLRLVYQSPEQQRSFNFPYQIQIGTEGDPPQIASLNNHEVKDNDIVVAGSDGLFDNLDEAHIIGTIRPFIEHSLRIPDVALVAEMIAKLAYRCSLDTSYDSPFAKRARQNFIPFRGGKSDDITVAVCQVRLKRPSSQ